MVKDSDHSQATAARSGKKSSLLDWEFDLTLPILAVLIIVLGWFMVVNYERALREGAIKAFETTQLEIVRAASRSVAAYAKGQEAQGRSVADVEQEILKLFIAPMHLLDHGDAWMYAPDRVIFDQSSDFPEAYRGKNMAEIFQLQRARGASHFEGMVADAAAGREGGGWYVWLPEKGPEIAAWAPVSLGDRVWTIGLSTPLSEILAATGVAEQSRNAIAMMALISIGGLGLAITSTRNIIERRKAEVELAEANVDLEDKVKRGARELAVKSQALMESRLREKIKEKEAQIAYASGLIQSAGDYLHHFGNSLTALETLLLRVRQVLDSTGQYPTALETIREAHAKAVSGEENGRTGQYLDLFEEALMGRAIPRLRENVEAMMDLKERMIASIESQRKAFERTAPKESFVQPVDLGEILGDIASERRDAATTPRVLVETEIAENVSIVTRKHPVIHGLNALVDLAVEAARKGNPEAARITITAHPGDAGRGGAVVVVRHNGRRTGGGGSPGSPQAARDGADAASLHGFVNFLNENSGKLHISDDDEGGEFVVELGDSQDSPEEGRLQGA